MLVEVRFSQEDTERLETHDSLTVLGDLKDRLMLSCHTRITDADNALKTIDSGEPIPRNVDGTREDYLEYKAYNEALLNSLRNSMFTLCGGYDERIQKALNCAFQYSQFDGNHHKAWAIDQIVRALLGCPMIKKTALDCNKKQYSYETQGESQEYLDWVKKFEYEDLTLSVDEDREKDYEWNCGTPP